VGLKRIFIVITISILLGLIVGKVLSIIYLDPINVKWASEETL
jgi:hypothetical protein